MTLIIPRPLRDFITVPYDINNYKNDCQRAASDYGSEGMAVLGMFGGGFVSKPLAHMLINAGLRVATVALGVFAFSTFGGSAPVALAFGAVISLPSALIVAGCGLLKFGVAAIIASFASGSFASLGIGLAASAGGWLALEYHDFLPWGIAEYALFEPIAKNLAEPLLRQF